MDEGFEYQESKVKTSTKIILFIIGLLLIVGVIVLFFNMNNFNVKKTVTYEVGDVVSYNSTKLKPGESLRTRQATIYEAE